MCISGLVGFRRIPIAAGLSSRHRCRFFPSRTDVTCYARALYPLGCFPAPVAQLCGIHTRRWLACGALPASIAQLRNVQAYRWVACGFHQRAALEPITVEAPLLEQVYC